MRWSAEAVVGELAFHDRSLNRRDFIWQTAEDMTNDYMKVDPFLVGGKGADHPHGFRHQWGRHEATPNRQWKGRVQPRGCFLGLAMGWPDSLSFRRVRARQHAPTNGEPFTAALAIAGRRK
jgi:hypothetical protein